MPAIHNTGSAASAGFALLAALAWGGGDFSGGMGVKSARGTTVGALRLVLSAHAASLLVLLGLLAFRHAAWPLGAPLVWGLAAGVAGGFSLIAFYIALSRGAMGASAAMSGLLAAAIPAVVALATEGAPSLLRAIGFALAAAAIWLIAATPSEATTPGAGSRLTTALAIGGGIGFGCYFVALRFANPLGVVQPMALARIGSLVTCLLWLACLRGRSGSSAERDSPRWLSGTAWLWAGGVALLDTGGNLLFVAASRSGRLDVSAVLASLYPASTILLAAAVLKERPSPRQFAGMAVAIAAAILITV